jgi:hypothetical protein
MRRAGSARDVAFVLCGSWARPVLGRSFRNGNALDLVSGGMPAVKRPTPRRGSGLPSNLFCSAPASSFALRSASSLLIDSVMGSAARVVIEVEINALAAAGKTHFVATAIGDLGCGSVFEQTNFHGSPGGPFWFRCTLAAMRTAATAATALLGRMGRGSLDEGP